jgi:hypothetical protein
MAQDFMAKAELAEIEGECQRFPFPRIVEREPEN